MNRPVALLLPALLMTLGHAPLAMAARYCTLDSGQLSYEYALPDIVKVDASLRPGEAISAVRQDNLPPISGTKFTCENDDDTNPINLNVDTLTGESTVPGPGGVRVMETNVAGIGVAVQLGVPFTGGANNYFKPTDNSSVPFTGTLGNTGGNQMVLTTLLHRIQLVKIGDIAPGVHYIDTPLFRASTSIGGQFMDYRLTSRVVSNPCTVPTTSSPAVVQLQRWPKSEFKGIDHTTASTDFAIELTNCESDPKGMTRVAITLEGIDGSTPISGKPGVFSLTDDSDAEGVGIQILKGDGTPMPLATEEDMANLTKGITRLAFKAHYYQTLPAEKIKPGSANGALKFTISYR